MWEATAELRWYGAYLQQRWIEYTQMAVADGWQCRIEKTITGKSEWRRVPEVQPTQEEDHDQAQ